jgi:toxin ParE1/3/4
MSPKTMHVLRERLPEGSGAAVGQLKAFPDIGRPGRVRGARELVVVGTPYVIPYRVKGEEVQILRVYHAARRWPKRL